MSRLAAWFGSVRARTTLVATVVVTVTLALGAIALLQTLEHSLTVSGDAAAQARVKDLATIAADGTLPRRLALAGEDDVAQVVDASGRVVASTPNRPRDAPIASFVPGTTEPVVRTVEGVREDDDLEDYRVWGLGADTPRGRLTVYVGSSLESVQDTLGIVRGSMAIGLPLLLVCLAIVSWFLVGRALSPVEAIRAEVAEISDQVLDRRVPVPAVRDEIGRLAETMNGMLDRLEWASRRQRAFVADSSHELQSPLTSFRAHLEVAMAHPELTDWEAVAADLLDETQRMEWLVRDLLFLAREDDRVQPRIGLVDFDDVVLDEASRVRSGAAVRVETTGVTAAPMEGSRDDLARMTRNLLENAVRHASSTVRVTLTTPDSGVELVVQDDGPGIPAEQRERVFDRFARLDQAARSRSGGGTGLGLAIARAIAERHGGTLRVADSDEGARLVTRLAQRPPR